MTIRPHKILEKIGIAIAVILLCSPFLLRFYYGTFDPFIDEVPPLIGMSTLIGYFASAFSLFFFVIRCFEKKPEIIINTPNWAKRKKKDPVLLAKLEEVDNKIREADESDLGALIRAKEILEEKLGL